MLIITKDASIHLFLADLLFPFLLLGLLHLNFTAIGSFCRAFPLFRLFLLDRRLGGFDGRHKGLFALLFALGGDLGLL